METIYGNASTTIVRPNTIDICNNGSCKFKRNAMIEICHDCYEYKDSDVVSNLDENENGLENISFGLIVRATPAV
jgi:hypothetical protein